MSNFLSSSQREQFIRDGYVAVSGLIPDDIVAKTRDDLCACLGISLTDKATWPSDSHLIDFKCIGLTYDCHVDALDDVAQELVGDLVWREHGVGSDRDRPGEGNYGKGFASVLAFPQAGEKRFDAEHKSGYHVDGIHLSSVLPRKMLLVAMIYLTDTEEYGGATALRPGSHRQIFEYWMERGEIPAALNIMPDLDYPPPIAVAVKAGDVVFMHHLMVHSGSPNYDGHVRLGLNANFASVLDRQYQPKSGPPTDDWTPLDWTLRTDNLPVAE